MTDDFLRVKQIPENRTYPMRIELASFYCEDAFDFHQRYLITFYSDQMDFKGVKSRRVKAYVDLRMAIEALLKSLVCLRVPRNLAGRPLVKEVKKYSHNIAKLKAHALKGIHLNPRFNDALNKCDAARIDLRYQFEAVVFREPDDRVYYETIGSDVWLKALEEFVQTGLTRLNVALQRRSKIVSGSILAKEIIARPSDYPTWPLRR